MPVVAGGLPQRVGPYVVQGVLGQGGMGTVLRARHDDLDVVRALKVLTSRQSATGAARFAREVAALASVRHPNVVGIHDSGDVGGLPWYAMDLIEGEPLDRILERGGALPLDRALEVTIGLCQGVDALHRAGVVHRDLKPQNVVITSDGRPVVLDLGLAIAPDRDERLTRTGAMVGTPSYMAPEQLAATPVSARTDVHALGLILFELVTGRVALVGGSVHDLMGKILSDERPRASELLPDLPVALDRVLARAMAREPAQRHASAAELAAELAALRAAPRLVSARVRRLHFLMLALLLGLAALVGLGVAMVALRNAPRPPQAPAADPAPVAVVRSTAPALPAPRRLTAIEREGASDELRVLAQDLDLGRRRALAMRWLARWPTHPDIERAHAIVHEVDRAQPRAYLRHEGAHGPGERALGRFVGTDQIVSVGADQTVRAWRLQREENGAPGEWREVRRERILMKPVTLVGSPDSAFVLMGGLARRYESGMLMPDPEAVDVGGPDDLASLAVSPDRAWLLGVRNDRGKPPFRVVLFSTRTGAHRDLGACRSPARDAVFTSPGVVVVAYGESNGGDDPEQAVKAFDVADGKERWSAPLRSQGRALATDGAGHVAVITEGGQLLVTAVEGAPAWKEFTANVVSGIASFGSLAHGSAGEGVAFGPAGRLYSLEHKGGLRTWDVVRQQEVAPMITAADPTWNGLAVSPDGVWLLVGTETGSLEVWAAPPQ